MKAYLSVFMLMVRGSIYKIIGLLSLMSITEYILFQRVLQQELAALDIGLQMMALQEVLAQSHIAWVLGITYVIMTILLCYLGCSYGSRQEYTWKRLRISERQVFFVQAVHNMVMYLLLLMVQIILAYWFCRMYLSAWEGIAHSNQIIFLAFYRSDFLHSILPMEDVGVWARNLILLIGLGLASAHYPYRQRREKNKIEIFPMSLILGAWFMRELGDPLTDGFSVILTLILIGVILGRLFDSSERAVGKSE